MRGEARPGAESSHEHLDGIAQLAVIGFDVEKTPGRPGFFILGEDGDSVERPTWAKDGSIVAVRQLKQLARQVRIAFFTGWGFLSGYLCLQSLPNSLPTKLQRVGSVPTGARIIRRWKSGSPIHLALTQDDPALGAHANRNSAFDFSHPDSYVRIVIRFSGSLNQ